MGFFTKSLEILPAAQTLPGRSQAIYRGGTHPILGHEILPPYPAGIKSIQVAMGCFWGAERLFWQIPGVYSTAVGYAGGDTQNPTYEEVCSGKTNHTEVVLVAYDPSRVSLEQLLVTFFEEHDPTQRMRQGNDVGTQYRSAIYVDNQEDLAVVERVQKQYQDELAKKGFPTIATEVRQNVTFFPAEDYHQQYLQKNPNGYCGLQGTGVSCPVGRAAAL